MAMVMAGCEDREGDQNQRGNQAASPPTILFQYLLLNSVETRFEALLRCFLLISGASCFLRHERLPLFFYFVELKVNDQSACSTCIRTRCRALIMPHQKHKTLGHGRRYMWRGTRAAASPSSSNKPAGHANRDDKLWIEKATTSGDDAWWFPEPSPHHP